VVAIFLVDDHVSSVHALNQVQLLLRGAVTGKAQRRWK
jgi:hypothetical protein